MKVLQTCALKSLEYGDYFQFKGRDQMYVCIGRFSDSSIHYQSTNSGRRYISNWWDKNQNSPVEILQYGN
ncbi:hypothetical protein SAMN05444371_3087 [Epilithonimonas mollis]|uniref:Uncharacterized protein n=1 Tax=Epilithonimonas mollis TaxID=216903 RepID=A0A1M6U2H8_9FLAO|nr:hypothetical protein SAMN05444371_3087 [Epilithonimonas mollis]